jgi:hypothetical protein
MLRPTLLAALAWTVPLPSQEPTDVVVYGGTSAGVIAAVHAARLGHSVLLLEPTHVLGGMSSSGLGATDVGNQGSIGGVAREFYRRLRRHYETDSAWTRESRDQFAGRGHRPGEDAVWTFEPGVARATFAAMLAETGVRVIRRARLALDGEGVRLEDGRIRSIRVDVDGEPRSFSGRIFLDATYEGDLLAHAGVSFHVGRESNATYGETLNGVQVENAIKHQFVADVDPWVVPGDPTSGPLPGVAMAGPGEQGSGDHRVQAYCFRLCTTDVAANRVPWSKPADYDERDFELLLRNFEAGDHRVPWHRVLMPNRKTDTNNNFAISTDAIGLNYSWPEANWAQRDAIFASHLGYTQGLLWTLANHPRVPENIRQEFRTWGRARDEWPETNHWPPQLYVREGRRMVSDVVMTERHCRGELIVDDPVGLGSYGMDSHNVQRYVTADGHVRNEGDVQVHGFPPYGISYRAIRPRRDECRNLLVPVAVSASHIAFGSIRMEPVFMVLGHSAATAAHLALASGLDVQEVDYAALRDRLVDEDQILAWQQAPRPVTGLDPARITGIVVDDANARLEGAWTPSTSVRPWVGHGYLHDSAAGDGRCSARFELSTTEPGRYRIDIAYPAAANRADAVPVLVQHRDVRLRVTVDQRRAATEDPPWQALATLDVGSDRAVVVTVRNDGTAGHVIVDALRMVRVD